MNIKERLGKELLFLDGGMGTLLQEQGLEAGELPETWNIKYPDRITNVHRRYYEAGSHIVLANTLPDPPAYPDNGSRNAVSPDRCLYCPFRQFAALA